MESQREGGINLSDVSEAEAKRDTASKQVGLLPEENECSCEMTMTEESNHGKTDENVCLRITVNPMDESEDESHDLTSTIGNEMIADTNLKIKMKPEEDPETSIPPGEAEHKKSTDTLCILSYAHWKTNVKKLFRWTKEESTNDLNKEGEKSLSKRGKIIRTMCAQAAYLGVTLNLGMIGPSLLDLETWTASSTQQMSTIFTWRACLGLVASLLMGPVLDHVDRFFLLALALMADVVFIAVAPWMRDTAALIATMAPPEFFNSIIGMGTHLICISIWKSDSGPSLQLLNLMATIGYTLSPLLCKPFLTPSYQNPSGSSMPYQAHTNETIETSVRSMNTTDIVNAETTRIQYAYLIVALYDLLIGSAVLAVFIYDGCNIRLKPEKEDDNKEENEEEDGKIRDKSFGIKICVLFFIFNVFYGGIEVGYAGLLMTFAVKYLGWSKATGTNVTAVLQASNAIVTASAVFISKWVKAQLLLFYSIIVVSIAMLVLSFAVHYNYLVLWFCTACLGIGYATIMPCSYTWVNEVMEVTGKFSSAYWSGFFVGFMVIPAITGHLFQHVNPMWLPYMTLICSLGMLILFSVISIVIFLENRKGKSTRGFETRTSQDN